MNPVSAPERQMPSIRDASGADRGFSVMRLLAERTLSVRHSPTIQNALLSLGRFARSEEGSTSVEMGFGLALVGGSLTALGIASTFLPLTTIGLGALGAANAFGMYSAWRANRSNPQDLFHKVWKFGKEKILPLALTVDSFLLLQLNHQFDMEFTEIFSHFSRSRVLLPGAVTTATIFAARVFHMVGISNRARMADPFPSTKLNTLLTNTFVEAGVWAKFNYLGFRSIMFATALYGTAGFLASTPAAAMVLLSGLGLNLMGRVVARKAETPALRKWTNRLTTIGTSAALWLIDPNIFWTTATTFLSGWALEADYHQGINALGFLWSQIKALNRPHIPLVSDQFMNSLIGPNGKRVMVVKPILDTHEFPFPVAVTLLINPYADMEMQVCHDRIPYESKERLMALRQARQAVEWIQNELQGFFHQRILGRFQEYRQRAASASSDVRQEYGALAELLEDMGDHYFLEDPETRTTGETVTPVLHQIRQKASERKELAKKNKEPTADWFKMDKVDPKFLRDAMNEIRLTAEEFFYRHAHELRQRMEQHPETLGPKELEQWYHYLLARYNRRVNLVVRKEDHHDDWKPSKSNNYAFTFTHAGDDLYKVWVYDKQKNDFYVEYVPARYVRIPNPHYDHTPESARWVWVRREDLSEELKFSQSGSDEIEFVNNAPDVADPRGVQVVKDIEFRGRKIEGFIYGNGEEALPARPDGLVVRTGASLDQKVAWTYGHTAPAGWKTLYESTIRERWGKNITDPTEWEKLRKEAQWFEESPSVLKITHPDFYLMSDAEHIDRDSPRRMSADLLKNTRNKYLRVFYYLPWEETLANPAPDRPVSQIKHLEVVDAYMEIKVKAKGEAAYTFPFDIQRGMGGMVGPVKVDDYAIGWEQVSGIRAFRDSKGKHLEVYYRGTNKTVVLPESMYPPLLPEPEEMEKLEINVFPNKVGSRSFLMADYGDHLPARQRYRFTRPLKERPWNFDASLVTQIVEKDGGQNIQVKSATQNPKVVLVDPRWMELGEWDDREPQTEVVRVVGTSKLGRPPKAYIGTKHVGDHVETAWAPYAEELIAKGYTEVQEISSRMVGKVRINFGDHREEHYVPLEGLDNDPALARRMIDIVPSKKLEVIYRESDYVYSLKPNTELKGIPDLSWIEDVTIQPDRKVRVRWINPHHADQFGEVTLDGNLFVDNEGNELLRHSMRRMRSVRGMYQADHYDGHTEQFRPQLVSINNQVKLVVTKVRRKRIRHMPPLLTELMTHPAATIEWFVYASMTSAVELEDRQTHDRRWVPLSLTDALTHTHLIANNGAPSRWKDGTAHNGEPLHYRTGNIMHGNLAGENRLQDTRGGDPAASYDQRCFYAHFALSKYPEITRQKYHKYLKGGGGELQPGKAADVDANGVPKPSTVQNGTPYLRRWDTVVEVAELERSLIHRYKQKMVLYGKRLAASGVSEDDEERYYAQRAWGWHNGFVSEPTSLAEEVSDIQKMDTQRSKRWGTSMELRSDQGLPYLWNEFWHGWARGDHPRFMAPGEIMNDLLFMTWYRIGEAELIRQLSPVVFLATGGRLSPYPVDKPYFLVSALADVATGLFNWSFSMYKGGFRPFWTLFRGPSRFLGLFPSYWRLVQTCYDKELQYGPFLVTSQTAGGIPIENKRFLKLLIGANLISIAAGATGTYFPFVPDWGIHAGNMFWGSIMLSLDYFGLRWLNRSERTTRSYRFAELLQANMPNIASRPTDLQAAVLEALHMHTWLRSARQGLYSKDKRFAEVRDEVTENLISLDTALLHFAKQLGQSPEIRDRYMAYGLYTYIKEKSPDNRMQMEAEEAQGNLGLQVDRVANQATLSLAQEMQSALAAGAPDARSQVAAYLFAPLYDQTYAHLPISRFVRARRIAQRFARLVSQPVQVVSGATDVQLQNVARLTHVREDLQELREGVRIPRRLRRQVERTLNHQVESAIRSLHPADPQFAQQVAQVFQAAALVSRRGHVERQLLRALFDNASRITEQASSDYVATHAAGDWSAILAGAEKYSKAIQSEMELAHEVSQRSFRAGQSRIRQLVAAEISLLNEMEARISNADELKEYVGKIYTPTVKHLADYAEKRSAQKYRSLLAQALKGHQRNLRKLAVQVAQRVLAVPIKEVKIADVASGWQPILTNAYADLIHDLVQLSVTSATGPGDQKQKVELAQFCLKELHSIRMVIRWRIAFHQIFRTLQTLITTGADVDATEGALRQAIDNEFIHNRFNAANWWPTIERRPRRAQIRLHNRVRRWSEPIRATAAPTGATP